MKKIKNVDAISFSNNGIRVASGSGQLIAAIGLGTTMVGLLLSYIADRRIQTVLPTDEEARKPIEDLYNRFLKIVEKSTNKEEAE